MPHPLTNFFKVIDGASNPDTQAPPQPTMQPAGSSMPPPTPQTARSSAAKRPRRRSDIAPSPLRPHVKAPNRFKSWDTPFSLARRQSQRDAGVAQEDIDKLFEVMLHSLDSATRATYSAGPKRFTEWCDKRSISEEQRMPVSADILALFIASHAGKVASTTVTNWLGGLRFWHDIHGAPWYGDDSNLISRTRKGVTNLVPLSSKRAKRPPVTREHMTTLRAGLNVDDPEDAAIWATASIAFWSCCRLGELTVPSEEEFTARKHATRGTRYRFASTRPSPSSRSTDYVSIPIPWTKTTMVQGADISVTARPNDPTCPFRAFCHHISVNHNIPSTAPLFAFRSRSASSTHSWSALTKDLFLKRCNQIWVAAGLPEMPGHGFRIGGATHLLLLGVPPDVVATLGRWKSNAFLDYWREVDQILPLFLATHNEHVTHSSISLSMERFAKKHKLRLKKKL